MIKKLQVMAGVAALGLSVMAGSAGAAPVIFMYGGGGHTLQENISARFENSTHFGSVATDGGIKAHSFYVRNNGDSNLIINAIDITGSGAANFNFSGEVEAIVPPNGFSSFVITFNPTSNGTKFAEVSVGTNAPGNALFEFNIAGIGVTDVPIKPDLDLNIITVEKSKIKEKNGVTYLQATYIIPISNNGDVASTRKVSSVNVLASVDNFLDDGDVSIKKAKVLKKPIASGDTYPLKMKVKLEIPPGTQRIIFQIESPDDYEKNYPNNLRFEIYP